MRVLLLGVGVAALVACGAARNEDAPDAGSCPTDHDKIREEIREVVAKYRGCTQDSDCTLVSPDVSCQSRCQAAVRADSVAALRTDLGVVDSANCTRPACSMSSASCVPVDMAFCLEGECLAGNADGGLALP